ncbi:hypothetical protein MOV66_23405 [Agrobacterium sp. SHOUNA12C]|nr:hypothetical protein [Agrobacterium sp. BETTINA12B]MCJ9759609.1 hypothetical protein [Agrobacterium sp. SHOUNA12C]
MKIRDFGVEIWMNRYETICEWNLAETCVESLTVAELLAMAGKTETILSELLPLKLTYGAIEGSDRLRRLIAGLYEKQAVENVVVTHGAIGANALVHETRSSRATGSFPSCRPISSTIPFRKVTALTCRSSSLPRRTVSCLICRSCGDWPRPTRN